jgi:hypothetical protein
MYTIKLTGILAIILLITCNLGFTQNLQNEEEELLRSLHGDYSADELYPELEALYSQQLQTKSNKSNVRIFQAGKGNNTHITMEGSMNNSDVIQYGENNLYKLDADGNRIISKAAQIGKNNYLEDIIFGNDIYRETIQVGFGNTIYNEGINNMPMIIQQKGVNKTIKISGKP